MKSQPAAEPGDRSTEWFVPRFGPQKLRLFIGILFLPYTGMVLAFATIGAVVSPPVHWDRVLAINVIYFLGLGIAAHCLDALGSRSVKPWGKVFSRPQLWLMALIALVIAYTIAIYYMVLCVPNLWVAAMLEGFFVFAYNLEWWNGKFHTDNWFAFSWGFLPVLAGCLMQHNRVTAAAFILGISMALFSLVEIKASRPYKELKRRRQALSEQEKALASRYEAILKSISLGVILLAIGLVIFSLSREPLAKPKRFVTPAKAGVQESLKNLDSGFCRNDVGGYLQEAQELVAVTMAQLPRVGSSRLMWAKRYRRKIGMASKIQRV